MSTPPAASAPARLAESMAITRQRLLEAQRHGVPASADAAISTGFSDLDDALDGGFRPGQLAVIGARACVGASTLARTMASNAARNGVATLLVSSAAGDQINRELISAAGRVPYRHVDRGALGAEEWERVDRAVAEISERPLWVVAGSDPTIVTLVEALGSAERSGDC